MGEYKKITKTDINMPKYCLFFIKEIQEAIDETNFDEYGGLELTLTTSKYPYCYDALKLVVKTFTKKGFQIKIPSFVTTKEGDKKIWEYKWDISKDIDDLPF